jgi:decaprenylphospho-beta-D-ribofuranose 2-oxidase
MARLCDHGMTLPVVPGTSQVTLGGAIASDIHGKNHHCDGGFARHVATLSLLTPGGGVSDVSPELDGELFYATLGGMGLTGVILQATIRAEPMSAPWVAADTDRTAGLEETLALMSGEEPRRYSVAWLDLLAAGSKHGRAIVSRADPLPRDALPPAVSRRPWAQPEYPRALLQGPKLGAPRRLVRSPLFPAGMRAFNALRWHSGPRRERGRPVAFVPYFFPLDALGRWNRLYGANGLLQYQFVLPLGSEAVLERCFALIRDRRLPVYLAVFKRFGAEFGGPLSFPLEGWTLAVDFPAGAHGLRPALDTLDALIAGAGGRVYLSKDARLRADVLASMYPRLDFFNSVRARIDPEAVLRSDLARRLGLCGAMW